MKNKIMLFSLLVIAVVLVSGCAQSGPSIKVKSPANNAILDGPNMLIELETQNFKDGNVLVSIDNKTTDYATGVKYTVKNLFPGEHAIKFTLQKDGKNLTENGKIVSASVTFTVRGAESVFGKSSKEQVDTRGLPAPPALPPSVKG